SSFLTLSSIVNLQEYHASRILVRKWFEQHVVDHAENRGRGADPQSQRGDRHRGKCTASSLAAQRIAQVAPEILNGYQRTQFSPVFLQQRRISKLTSRR